jgi:hypothetical protein
MGGVLFALAWWWQSLFSAEMALGLRIGLLLALVAGGAGVYFAHTFATGAFRPGTLRQALRRRG